MTGRDVKKKKTLDYRRHGHGKRALCESGWTDDRCTKPLFHKGEHSNA